MGRSPHVSDMVSQRVQALFKGSDSSGWTCAWRPSRSREFNDANATKKRNGDPAFLRDPPPDAPPHVCHGCLVDDGWTSLCPCHVWKESACRSR
mmetsp:Transcript_5780/g.35903  ORF Transcript_5780/g.35903 Transcript_5780/m.35903 type:complete len:94 (+) Transcript_5780:16-297(+)